MKVLHLLKTSIGAAWALWQMRELVRYGLDVHVAMPPGGSLETRYKEAGVVIHPLQFDLPVLAPWRTPGICERLRALVHRLCPDIIHSHFVGTTLTMRLALGRDHPIPRIFQVPGPLHLEHSFFRWIESATAGNADYWIASSRCILDRYKHNGVSEDKLFLSYYGIDIDSVDVCPPVLNLKNRLGIRQGKTVVGNVNFMYPPKYYLGQCRGVKGHEDVIDALGEVLRSNDDLLGVFVGGQWGGGNAYERRLRIRARKVADDRIRFTGAVPYAEARAAWSLFDLAVHVPISENCGGAVEPLLNAVPTIAGRVGGLPEVVIHGKTGWLVQPGDPHLIAKAVKSALNDLEHGRKLALRGRRLVMKMFDIERTSSEIYGIYRHILDPRNAPPESFNSESFL